MNIDDGRCVRAKNGGRENTYGVQFASGVVDGEDVCYVVLGELTDVFGVSVVADVQPR